MEAILKKTTKADQQLAVNSLKSLQLAALTIKSAHSKGVKIKIQETGSFFIIPKNALLLLAEILRNMAAGKSISINPSEAEVTTQQAADMLNVSRPHLVKLLESGQIPFKKVGKHRRILLHDIIVYKENLLQERAKQLDFLANQAQELKLGYE